MFALYKKTQDKNGILYQFDKEICIFGCNVGYIPKMLGSKLQSSDNEPLKWELIVEEELERMGEISKTILIDIKPNSKEYILICELTNVYGYSAHGWTPVLFKLRGLIIDELVGSYEKKSFLIEHSKEIPCIKTCTLFGGTILKGAISGKWTSPLPSPTNSVLIWPEVWEYFASCC